MRAAFAVAVLALLAAAVADAPADLFETVDLVCHPCNSSVYCVGGQRFPCPAHSSSGPLPDVIDDCVCHAGYLRVGDVCNLGQPPAYYTDGQQFACPTQQATVAAGAGAVGECVCVPGSAGPGDGAPDGCAYCAADFYQPLYDQAACVRCPNDASHSLTNQTAVEACLCDPGHTGPDGGPCQDCAAGTFKTAPGSAVCEYCLPNFYSLGGAVECTPCRANSTSRYGSNEELDCECDPGFRLHQGSCEQCAAGFYTDVKNNDDVCKPCSGDPYGAGYYQDAVGQTACLQCSSQYAVSLPTYTGCQCNVGFRQTAVGLVDPECFPCFPGQYQDDVGKTNCTDCPAFSSSSVASDHRTDCFCLAGYYEHDSLTNECRPCRADTFKPGEHVNFDVEGELACQACPHNSSSPQQSTAQTDCLCDPGFSGPDGGTCVECALGFFKDAPGSAACAPCAEDSYADATATVTCTACPAHSKSPAQSVSLAACVCDHTTGYDVLAPNTACALCPAGTFATAAGCVQCQPGEFAHEGSTACSLCAVNTVSLPDFSGCECQPGYACTDAPLNIYEPVCNGDGLLVVESGRVDDNIFFDYGVHHKENFELDIAPNLIMEVKEALAVTRCQEICNGLDWCQMIYVEKQFGEVIVTPVDDEGDRNNVVFTSYDDNQVIFYCTAISTTAQWNGRLTDVLYEWTYNGYFDDLVERGECAQIVHARLQVKNSIEEFEAEVNSQYGGDVWAHHFTTTRQIWNYTTFRRISVPDGSTCNCVACPADFYKPNAGSVPPDDEHGGCQACPANTNAPSASVALVECKCDGGYETVDGSFGLECTACAPGEYAVEHSQTCVACGAHRYTATSDFPWDLASDCSVCEVCPPDTFDSVRSPHGCGEDIKALCIDCPENTASYDRTNTTYRIDETSCACVADMFGPLGGPCLGCPPNTRRPEGPVPHATNVSHCVCAPGFTRVGGTCVECANGFFKTSPGDGACTPCPTSMTTELTGATTQDLCVCAPGEFLSSTSPLACSACPTDTFQTAFARPSACQACRNNATSPPGATAPRDCLCDPGYEELVIDGFYACIGCERGQNKSAQSNGLCAPCPVDTFTNTHATAVCTDCPSSSSTLGQTGQTVCSCDAGLVGLLRGGDACAACPDDTFRSDLTTLDCAACGQCGANEQVDTVCVPAADITCRPCQNNSNSQPGRTELGICNCNPGFELVGSACVACAVGKARAASSDNAVLCETCAAGTVALTEGLAACPACQDACPEGEFVATECTALTQIVCQTCATCVPGEFVNVSCGSGPGPAYEPGVLGRGDTQCAQCPQGTYCPDGVQRVQCPGATNSLPGSTSAEDCGCDPGFYRPNPTSACVLCPFDFYCPGEESPALPCPANSVTLAEGESVRTACHCHRGYYRSPERDELNFHCAVCTPNDFCFNNSRFDCPDARMVAANGSGYFANCTCIDGFFNDGTTCTDCPADHFCRDGVSTACPASEWTAGHLRQTTCQCRPGLQRPGDGTVDPASVNPAHACQPCPADSFCPGYTQVHACTANSTSPAGSDDQFDCQCEAGFQPARRVNNTHACEPCSEGSTFKDFVNNSACLACAVCTHPQYTESVCRTAHNAVCQPCAVCNSTEFVATRCQAGSVHTQNRVCQACAVCDYSLEFEHTACGSHADTRCDPISFGKQCPPGEYAGLHTQTSDAVCAPCDVAGDLHQFTSAGGFGVYTYNEPRSCQLTCVGFSRLRNASALWLGCETCEQGNALLKVFDPAAYAAGTRTDCVFTCKPGYLRVADDCVPAQTVTSNASTPGLLLEITAFERDATGSLFTVSHSNHNRFVIAVGAAPATGCKYSSSGTAACCYAHMTRVSTLAQLGLRPGAPEPCATNPPLSHQQLGPATLQFSVPDAALLELANCSWAGEAFGGARQCALWLSIVDTIAWRAVSRLAVVSTTRATSVAFLNSPTLLLPLAETRAEVLRLGPRTYLLVLRMRPAARESGAPKVSSVAIRAPGFVFVPAEHGPDCPALEIDALDLENPSFSLDPDATTTVAALFEGDGAVLKAYLALSAGDDIMDVAVVRNVTGLPDACPAPHAPVYFDLGTPYAAAGLGARAVGEMAEVQPDAPAELAAHGPAGTLLSLVARAVVDYVTAVSLRQLVVVHLRAPAVAAYAAAWSTNPPTVTRAGLVDLSYDFRVWCRAQADADGSACQYHYLHADSDPAGRATHAVDCASPAGRAAAAAWVSANFGAPNDASHVHALCAFTTDAAAGNTHKAAAVLVNTRAFMDRHEAWTTWQDWDAQPFQTKVWSTFEYSV